MKHEVKVEPEVAEITLLGESELAVLAANGVRTLDELADLASDELIDIIGAANLQRERADRIIMAARAHWFEPGAKAAA